MFAPGERDFLSEAECRGCGLYGFDIKVGNRFGCFFTAQGKVVKNKRAVSRKYKAVLYSVRGGVMSSARFAR